MSETVNDDNFEEAFARLAAMGDKPALDPAPKAEDPPAEPPATPPAAEEPPAEPPATPPAAEEPPAELPATPPAAEEPPAEPPKSEEPPAPSASDAILNRLADLMQGRAQEPTPTPPATPEPELYTADEKAVLAKFEEEWPDVSNAGKLQRRGEYRELLDFVFRTVSERIGPMMERLDAVAQRTHLSDLQTRVSGYEEVRDKVVDWVATQPAYLKAAYTHVVEQGTVDEVADLIDRWRKETGSAVAPAAPAAPPARKAEPELPPAAKQAAAALAPVSSKRSAVVAGVDPDDFDSAFKMADETL